MSGYVYHIDISWSFRAAQQGRISIAALADALLQAFPIGVICKEDVEPALSIWPELRKMRINIESTQADFNLVWEKLLEWADTSTPWGDGRKMCEIIL